MKKQILTIVLIISIIFTAGACSSGKETVTGIDFDWNSAEAVSFEEMLKEASETHKQESLDREALNDFETYLGSGETDRDILTEEEISILLEDRPLNNDHISTDAFKEDIDLFFRALKHYYGAYYYFGGDKTFSKIQTSINKYVMDLDPDVPASELISVFNDYLDFVQDRNFTVHYESTVIMNNLISDYYYCGLYFSKDETGYYTVADGQKWYYESCKNEGVTIQPVLTPDGEVKYSPVLCRPSMRVRLDDTIILVCGDKQAKAEFLWTQGEAFSLGGSGEDFEFLEADGISYICIRNLAPSLREDVSRQFEKTAEKVKDSKLIIYDLRGCRGEEEDFVRNWAANFTGNEPQLNGCIATRADGDFGFIKSEGTFSENDIPIIVLTDSNTSAAGEMAMLYAKTIENAVVIGSNTSGNQLSGDMQEIFLPNSGVKVFIPTSMKLWNNTDNVDGIGYEPDIWCAPETVLDTVASLLAKEGYAESGIIEKLNAAHNAAEGSGTSGKANKGPRIVEAVIQHGTESIENMAGLDAMIEKAMNRGEGSKMVVIYDSYVIGENDPFGGENFDDDLVFFFNKEKISDYTVTFDNPDIAEVTYSENGSVHIKLPTPGRWPFQVNYKGESYRFILAV